MATYKQIRQYVTENHHRGVETCWIAHVKELNGLRPRVAPNRIDRGTRANPCSNWARPLIEEAMRHFRMIQ